MSMSEDNWNTLEQYLQDSELDVIIDNPLLKLRGHKLVHEKTKEIRYSLSFIAGAAKNRRGGPLVHYLFSEEEYREVRSRLKKREDPREVLQPFGGLTQFASEDFK